MVAWFGFIWLRNYPLEIFLLASKRKEKVRSIKLFNVHTFGQKRSNYKTSAEVSSGLKESLFMSMTNFEV